MASVDYSRCYHQGVRVPDLGIAMADLGDALALEWCEPQEREQAVWFPDVGAATVTLRFTYSVAGPQHIELLEGAPGSVWDGRERPGLHHVGLWSEDLPGETTTLIDAGWRLSFAQRGPDEGYGVFSYVQPPSGLLVELVSISARPMFERWFAGGLLA
jgi:catechol 2,3-dioxygenase-like lactoylglutathione lyase family enzyme